MARQELDLGPALKDAYLRKSGFGRGCETVELTFHVLRRMLGRQERDPDRMIGFRFRGVRSIATEAVRWDRDAGKWMHAKLDWLGALAKEQLERPIVMGALLDADATLERWGKAAEASHWLRGQPANLDAAEGGIATVAPVLFEAGLEVVLPNGWNANARIFIAADILEVVGSRGPMPVEDLVQSGHEWLNQWRQYWARKERRPEMPEEAQFEWLVPEEGGG